MRTLLIIILSILSVSLTAQTKVTREVSDPTLSVWKVIHKDYSSDQVKGIVHSLNICLLDGTSHSIMEKVKISKELISKSTFSKDEIKFNLSHLPSNLKRIFHSVYGDKTPFKLVDDIDYRTDRSGIDSFIIDIRCKVTNYKGSYAYEVAIYEPHIQNELKLIKSGEVPKVIQDATESILTKTLASYIHFICPEIHPLYCLEMAYHTSFVPVMGTSRATLDIPRSLRVSEVQYKCILDYFDGLAIDKISSREFNLVTEWGDIVGKFKVNGNTYSYESI